MNRLHFTSRTPSRDAGSFVVVVLVRTERTFLHPPRFQFTQLTPTRRNSTVLLRRVGRCDLGTNLKCCLPISFITDVMILMQ